MRLLWLIVGVGAILAGGFLYLVLKQSSGAPQEASGAAIALCIAVIPYVFARAFEGWQTASWREELLQELKRRTAAEPSTSEGISAARREPQLNRL